MAGPLLSAETSATLLTVVWTRLVLLAPLVSVSLAAAMAVLVRMPSAVGVTVTVKLLNAPLPRLNAGQPTVPALLVPPPVAPLNVTLAGNTSVNAMPVAVDGPLLVTATL